MTSKNFMKNSFAVFCTIIMVSALFIGGAQPIAVHLLSPPWDKLAHGLFFFTLFFLFRLSTALPLWCIIGATVAIGAADELHQLLLPGRSAGFDDWLADVIGVMLAVASIWMLRHVRQQKQT